MSFGMDTRYFAGMHEQSHGGGTAVVSRYHYQVSQLAQTSLRLYLATRGRDKIGFTVGSR